MKTQPEVIKDYGDLRQIELQLAYRADYNIGFSRSSSGALSLFQGSHSLGFRFHISIPDGTDWAMQVEQPASNRHAQPGSMASSTNFCQRSRAR